MTQTMNVIISKSHEYHLEGDKFGDMMKGLFLVTSLFLVQSALAEQVKCIPSLEVPKEIKKDFYQNYKIQTQRLGVGSSGGGDNIRHYFISEANEIFNELKKHPKLIKDLVSLNSLKEVIDVKYIKVTSKKLIDNTGSIVDAFASEGQISLNEEVWINYIERNDNVKWLVLHELLRASGVNDDNYIISNKIIERVPGITFKSYLAKCGDYKFILNSSIPVAAYAGEKYIKIDSVSIHDGKANISVHNKKLTINEKSCEKQAVENGLVAQILIEKDKIQRSHNINLETNTLTCLKKQIYGFEGAFTGVCTVEGDLKAPNSNSTFSLSASISDGTPSINYNISVIDGEGIDPF
ncbi:MULTISPECIES: hypothetical protein [unclassified Halobacteriovorax]|uniref:hypothetical protein n=1 Tax=unclassified Halobacteriovorax TaxID=2639665 RepID=UPI00399B4DA1